MDKCFFMAFLILSLNLLPSPHSNFPHQPPIGSHPQHIKTWLDKSTATFRKFIMEEAATTMSASAAIFEENLSLSFLLMLAEYLYQSLPMEVLTQGVTWCATTIPRKRQKHERGSKRRRKEGEWERRRQRNKERTRKSNK